MHLIGMRRVSLVLLIACCLQAQSFSPDDVKILGDLSYGETGAPVSCSAGAGYCAFVFSGQGDDQVQVTVKADAGTATVAIADGSLKQLASGTNTLSFTLPNRGPDAEAYYIVFRDKDHKPGRFIVALNKIQK